MLITCLGWEIERRIGRRLIVKDECIVKRSAKIVNENSSLSGLEGGHDESAEACGAPGVLLRTRGSRQ